MAAVSAYLQYFFEIAMAQSIECGVQPVDRSAAIPTLRAMGRGKRAAAPPEDAQPEDLGDHQKDKISK